MDRHLEDSNTIPFRIQDLLDSISNQTKIRFYYKDDSQPRLFSPYLMREADTGNLIMMGIQDHDPAKPENDGMAKTFILSEIRSLTPTNETFEIIDGFDLNRPSLRKGLVASVEKIHISAIAVHHHVRSIVLPSGLAGSGVIKRIFRAATA